MMAKRPLIWSWAPEAHPTNGTVWRIRNPLPRLQKGEIFEMLRRSLHLQMPSQSPPAVTGANCESPTKRVCADWRATSRCNIIVYPTIVRRTREYWKPPSTRKLVSRT